MEGPRGSAGTRAGAGGRPQGLARLRDATPRPPHTNFAHNFPRSFFETTQKHCNSNDANSMFEQAAGELRAELMSGSRARIGKSRMQFPHGTNQHKLKNRRISTIRFQHLKYTQGNCMRNYCAGGAWPRRPWVARGLAAVPVGGAGPGCGARGR